ncbi:hypothetical protein KUCAC02_035022 [Chaenocephalus aceratus]|nr:hypothetical protein KUCAC02_035022 [Chaenocephalus aceratus]
MVPLSGEEEEQPYRSASDGPRFPSLCPSGLRSWQGSDSNTGAATQSCREAGPKGGGSHVACNFLEAIKSTLFNSLSNTPAILAAKWPFSAKLSVQRRACESTLQNKAQHIG